DHFDFAAGHGMDGSIGVAQDRSSQRHGFHDALHSRDAHGIADIVLVLRQYEKTVDEILDQSLGAETNGQADNPRASEQRAHVDAQQRQDLHRGNENDDKDSDAVDDAGQRAELLGTNRRGQVLAAAEFSEMPRNQFEQASQDESDNQDRKDSRHLVAREIKRVIAPVINYLKDAIWGHNCSQGEFDNRRNHRCGDYSNAS